MRYDQGRSRPDDWRRPSPDGFGSRVLAADWIVPAAKVEDRAKDRIEYPDKNLFIRRKFEEQLAKRGVKSLMPEGAYSSRHLEWSKALGKQ